MPRNSQGLYTLPAGNPVVPNTLIEANWANPTMDDIAAALTGSLPRDGSAPMVGPLTLSSTPITAARQATSKAYVDQFLAFSSGLPIGAVVAYAGAAVPPGYFECNGQAVSRTTYSALFTAIGTTYGAGDASTTFNVPDMRDEFIRGKSDTRALGNKQGAAFASHVHTLSDPGHGHGASGSQNAHSHSITTGSHNHSVNDPGHNHGLPTGASNGGGIFAWAQTQGATFNTNGANTGVSVNGVGNLGGNTDSQTPGVSVSVSGNTTGMSLGAAGGDETRPQNIAQIYIIKAVQDASGPVPITGITTSDAQMISVDNTLPISPELVIHSNVAFGTVKLDASGKVPLGQMSVSSASFLGYFDASSGNLPVGTFSSGDYYAVSVQGTLTVYNPVTLVAAPTLVVVGSQLHYVSGSITNPTGWYTITVSGATLASDVQFIPVGTISGTNVQLAISELDSETQTALGGKAPSTASTGAGTSFPPSGSISASNVTAAIQELDSETVKLAGGTMTGNLVGTDFSSPTIGVGTSATPANNFTLDASANNGTMKLARESGQAIMTVATDGSVAFPAAPLDVIFRAANIVGQALYTGSNVVAYPTIEINTETGWNASTNEFTVQKAGLYMISTITRIAYGSAAGELSGGGIASGAGVKQSGTRVISTPVANSIQWPVTNIVAWCPVGAVIKTTWFCENAASIPAAAAQNTNMTISRIG